MAVLKCLIDHTPLERHQQTYVRPTYDLPCDTPGCSRPAVIWLNPEEVKDYERGTRVFWEPSSFATMRAGDAGPQRRPWDVLQAASTLFGSMNFTLRSYLMGWRREPVTLSPQSSELPPAL